MKGGATFPRPKRIHAEPRGLEHPTGHNSTSYKRHYGLRLSMYRSFSLQGTKGKTKGIRWMTSAAAVSPDRFLQHRMLGNVNRLAALDSVWRRIQVVKPSR